MLRNVDPSACLSGCSAPVHGVWAVAILLQQYVEYKIYGHPDHFKKVRAWSVWPFLS